MPAEQRRHLSTGICAPWSPASSRRCLGSRRPTLKLGRAEPRRRHAACPPACRGRDCGSGPARRCHPRPGLGHGRRRAVHGRWHVHFPSIFRYACACARGQVSQGDLRSLIYFRSIFRSRAGWLGSSGPSFLTCRGGFGLGVFEQFGRCCPWGSKHGSTYSPYRVRTCCFRDAGLARSVLASRDECDTKKPA